MGDSRLFTRTRHVRLGRGSCIILSCAVVACLIIFLLRERISSSIANSGGLRSSLQRKVPNIMFVSIADSACGMQSLQGVNTLDLKDQVCVFRLYTTSAQVYNTCLRKHNGLYVTKHKNCIVDVRFQTSLQMWGDVTLDDVPKSTTVIFLRESIKFTSRALDWLLLAHAEVIKHYAAGGRREYAGAAIGCYGEMSLSPWWSHAVGPLNTTCAYSPLRQGREDTWELFSHWFRGRKREWVSWPHVWEDEIALPSFWKESSRRDRGLAKLGRQSGKEYGFVGNPYLLWERWFTRWAASYNMRVASAESNMGLGFHDDRVGSELDTTAPVSNEIAERMPSTRHGDSVRIGSLWYEPVDGEFGHGYFKALQGIVGDRPSLVSLTVVNSQVLELAKSWLCNVRQGGFEPPNIYWITLDEESKEALDASVTGRTVGITDILLDHNMHNTSIQYGQPAYWKVMLMRTRLIRDLLDRGIDVLLFETDQVWLQDPVAYIREELRAGADMVATLDSRHDVPRNLVVCKSVISTRKLWHEVYQRYKKSYDEEEIERKASGSQTFVAHDQFQLSELLLFDRDFVQDYPVALGLLNTQAFVDGTWYTRTSTRESAKRLVIVNNNLISGVEQKKARAREFGHWFLKEDNRTCDESAVSKALQYEFLRWPGRQERS